MSLINRFCFFLIVGQSLPVYGLTNYCFFQPHFNQSRAVWEWVSGTIESLDLVPKNANNLVQNTHCDPNLRASKQRFESEDYDGKILLVENTTSTMDVAKSFSGIADILVVASSQSAGRGRKNSSWDSPHGDIYMTLNRNLDLLDPDVVQTIATISSVEAIQKLYGGRKTELSFVWPNSIYWMGIHKIGGVLVEQNSEGLSIGVGLRYGNYSSCPGTDPGMVHANSVHDYVKSRPNLFSKETIIVAIANRIRQQLSVLSGNPEAAQQIILEKMQERKFLLNFQGRVVDVGPKGELVLSDEHGMRISVDPHHYPKWKSSNLMEL